MKTFALATVFSVACALSAPGVLLARGSAGGHSGGGHGGGAQGGHGGGGHGGGGHAGGGTASGGHGGGGHAGAGGGAGSGGQQGGGHGGGGSASGGGAGTRSGGSASSGGTVRGGTAVGRTAPASPPPATGQPSNTRSRGDRPAIGTAVQRPETTFPSAGLLPSYSLFRTWPYRNTFAFRGFGGYYDPFWYSTAYWWPDPFLYGPLLTYPGYSSSGYGYAPYPFDDWTGPNGSLRLKIDIKDAQVFVDGYYAGIVDDFDGHFQHLKLTPGPHHVEVRAPGYEPLQFDVNVQARHTTEFRGTLVPTVR